MAALGLPYNSNLLNFFNGMFGIGAGNQDNKKKTEDFYDRIWNQLRELFNSYLKGGARTLRRNDIKLLIKDILKQQTQQELDYVFWNYFRLDKDQNQQVEFEQFAPFILNHTTEIALQRFHVLEQKGKDFLSISEFVKLSGMAFSFLRSIPKQEPVLRIIYNSLDTDRSGDLSYKEYLMWAKTLVNRYKK